MLLGDETDEIGNDVERGREREAVKMFDQTEDVPLGLRQWIEPAFALVNDDDDVVATAVFDRLAGAFLQIDGKAGGFQDGPTIHFLSQLCQFGFFHSLSALRAVLCPGLRSLTFRGWTRRPRRARQDKGADGKPAVMTGRGFRRQKRRSLPCRPPRTSGMGVLAGLFNTFGAKDLNRIKYNIFSQSSGLRMQPLSAINHTHA